MRVRRLVTKLALGLGLRHLSGGRTQKVTRSILDEIDLQYLRDAFKGQSCRDREQLYAHLQQSILHNEPIDYLEFGVHTGQSLRTWTELNGHPSSRFFGFDSFEGLPTDWRAGQSRGHFDVGGALPRIDDPRVTFVKGWFEQTVPTFARTFSPQNRLVLHLDADLYSSSMWALMFLAPHITSGTVLLFDEFYDRDHEFKAYRDWTLITGHSGTIVAESDSLAKVAILVD